MLREAGIEFLVAAPQAAELTDPALPPRELCGRNAAAKALDVAGRHEGHLVLGADTVVTLEGRTFGKPDSMAAARDMLEMLCGRTHEVLTGVCLVPPGGGPLTQFVESTRVRFRPREEVDLEAYLADVNPLDKAGAYAAQEDGGRLIEEMEGSLSNVIGLPVDRVREVLGRGG